MSDTADTAAAAATAEAEDLDAPVAQALAWLLPQHRATPADALQRIRVICEQAGSELYPALLLVLATHQAVPREILAAAVKQFRRDCDAFSREDVCGLLNGIANGGYQGFDVILRTRKTGEKKSSGFSWIREDDQ
ncbi:MAG TPA: hypothetical protein VLA61_05395 [Ideonella sp.]|uniref:hypothetical protein n=1 Tax=Ideonella sp. TaxID=1929293 RepID=UPI002D142FDE|nr:hypothetical protein [Ideonella sp.]HSI47680.1 hypothetical protein [Ideonella sp.]